MVLNITRKNREWRFYEFIGLRLEDLAKVSAVVSDIRKILRQVSALPCSTWGLGCNARCWRRCRPTSPDLPPLRCLPQHTQVRCKLHRHTNLFGRDLSTNPQIDTCIALQDPRVLQKLHRRVFLDKITRDEATIYLSFYVEAANRDAFMAGAPSVGWLAAAFCSCVVGSCGHA